MKPEAYTEHDAVALAALIRDGELTAGAVAEAALERLHALQPELNAFVWIDAEGARQAAATATGNLAGVPFAVKDLWLEWAAGPHGAGSKLTRAEHRHTANAPMMQSFLDAGLVPLGRTATPEFGITGTTEPARSGAVRNPWDSGRIAGGSSGGSAAAVAAGIVPVAHASDGAGSIRIPAACCGLVGLMPSRGRTTKACDGLDVPFTFSRNFVVSRSVRDSAAVLDAVADTSAYAPPRPSGGWLASHQRAPGRLRIRASTETPSGRPIDPEIERAFETTLAQLDALGHEVERAAPPIDWRRFFRAFSTVGAAQLAADIDGVAAELGREPQPEDLEPLTWRNLRAGRTRTGPRVIESLREVQRVTRQMEAFFDSADVYVSPVLGTPLPSIGELDPVALEPTEQDRRSARAFPFTPPFNATGQPAMSLPVTTDAAGLPTGMQFVGRYGDELTLLALAAQLETATGWRERRPPLAAWSAPDAGSGSATR